MTRHARLHCAGPGNETHPMGLIDTLLGRAGETSANEREDAPRPLPAEGERIEHGFALVRDVIAFSGHRLILVNKQGVSTRKTEYRGIPYRGIATYTLESARRLDLNAEFKRWLFGQPDPIESKLGRGEATTRLVAPRAQHMPRRTR
ncbi:PH domain-containing protein [Lysobacter pythonis]|uniref:PH domain-containing protein n=1 Tax=Solilutibacter pythonis TaxID=2483112 RepID=A0A3M2HH46_9GAMM|nr:PH domain-containing protein [Lysobacter pythonis]RMH89036.1 PH domain-containing protein [Lysobacter pythonis]